MRVPRGSMGEVAERCLGHKIGGVEGTYDSRLWIAKQYLDWNDNLLCVASGTGNNFGREDCNASLHMGNSVMKTTYYPQDDILEIHFSDKPIAREVSQDWNVNLSYAADGSLVEVVILDAVKAGLIPFESGEGRRSAA